MGPMPYAQDQMKTNLAHCGPWASTFLLLGLSFTI